MSNLLLTQSKGLVNAFPASEWLGFQLVNCPLKGTVKSAMVLCIHGGTEIIASRNIIFRKFLLILRSINT